MGKYSEPAEESLSLEKKLISTQCHCDLDGHLIDFEDQCLYLKLDVRWLKSLRLFLHEILAGQVSQTADAVLGVKVTVEWLIGQLYL